jgi:hypothetical protein
MTYAILALAFGGFGFAAWAIGATVRNGGLKVERTQLENANGKLSRALQEQTAEYLDYKKRAQQRIEHLVDEIEGLEDKQHAEIAKIEDPEKRRNRRRAFVADVLGSVLQEAPSASSADEAGVPGESSTDTTEDSEDS